VAVKEGIPVTTVPRTTFDLAATEPLDAVISMLREAEHRNLWDRLSLWDLVERYPPAVAGCGTCGWLCSGSEKSLPVESAASWRSGSHRSSAATAWLSPRFNDWILLEGKRYQVDCHRPGTDQIVELDGWEGHGTRKMNRRR
jgi:hypothetical protein